MAVGGAHYLRTAVLVREEQLQVVKLGGCCRHLRTSMYKQSEEQKC